MIGILVPAHNEEDRIGACLDSLQRAALDPALDGEDVCIVVALDACTDGTWLECQRRGVETLSLDACCVGVARAAAADVLLARGARWLASTDGDSEVPADWLSGQLAGGHDVFCGLVDLKCETTGQRLYQLFHQAERWGHDHGRIHGANLGIAARTYLDAGGFDALECHEDVALVRRLEAGGTRVHWADEPRVLTSARLHGRAPHGFAAYLRDLEARLGAGPDVALAGGTP